MLAIFTNIPVLLMTAFLVQSHILISGVNMDKYVFLINRLQHLELELSINEIDVYCL